MEEKAQAKSKNSPRALLNEQRAQVNLEYLLIIVGAVAVVTVVSLYMKQTANTVAKAGQDQAAKTP